MSVALSPEVEVRDSELIDVKVHPTFAFPKVRARKVSSRFSQHVVECCKKGAFFDTADNVMSVFDPADNTS